MINQKGIIGLLSGIISTSVLQPFQNVKMAIMLPPKDLILGDNFIVNLLKATKYINMIDGISGFYKGFIAANIKAGLGCYIYFTVLRYSGIQQDSKLYQDFLLSSSARIISTIFTNPFNVIETRFQLANFHHYKSVRGAILDIYRKQGFFSFFSGAMASCWKEGFFAGLYYMMYEQLKDRGTSKLQAGIFSGMISTAITHPFQIIRAKIQTQGLVQKHTAKQHLILQQLQKLIKYGGWFTGLTPRLFKKPLANTLTFYIFQHIQDFKRFSPRQ